MNNDKEQRDEAKGREPKQEQEQEQGFGELRHYVPAEILNVSPRTLYRWIKKLGI